MSIDSQANCNDLFAKAFALHQADHIDAAEPLYEQVIARDPCHALALHSLGCIAYTRGRYQDAERLLRRAIESNSKEATFHHSLAQTLRSAGRMREAVASLNVAVALNPGFVGTWQALAELYHSLSQHNQALAALSKMTELQERVKAFNTKGVELVRQKRFHEACAAFRAGIACDPNAPGLYYNLGSTLTQLGQLSDAAACLTKASRLAPKSALAPAGISADRRPLAIREPARDEGSRAQTPASKGAMLLAQGQTGEAIPHFRHAIEMGGAASELSRYWCDLGTALATEGNAVDAVEAFGAAISLDPANDRARVNRALVLIKSGDFQAGWAEYEWRKKLPEWRGLHLPGIAPWRGESVEGKTIALLAEQGLGDCIQFVRYATLLARRGARVTAVCFAELQRLFTTIAGIETAYAAVIGNRIRADFQCDLLSLPLIFGTTLDTVPWEGPYITADSTAAAGWSRRLGQQTGPRVGLVWAGKLRPEPVHYYTDLRRSFDLAIYAPLFEIPGLSFYSLQKDLPTSRITGTFPVAEFPQEIHDFLDVVPLIDTLDLIISVDTSVVHLAGAMGKEVWMLSRYDSCWRWLFDRKDTPWYPTLRIFRQHRPGDWTSVIAEVKSALHSYATNWFVHHTIDSDQVHPET